MSILFSLPHSLHLLLVLAGQPLSSHVLTYLSRLKMVKGGPTVLIKRWFLILSIGRDDLCGIMIKLSGEKPFSHSFEEMATVWEISCLIFSEISSGDCKKSLNSLSCNLNFHDTQRTCSFTSRMLFLASSDHFYLSNAWAYLDSSTSSFERSHFSTGTLRLL